MTRRRLLIFGGLPTVSGTMTMFVLDVSVGQSSSPVFGGVFVPDVVAVVVAVAVAVVVAVVVPDVFVDFGLVRLGLLGFGARG